MTTTEMFAHGGAFIGFIHIGMAVGSLFSMPLVGLFVGVGVFSGCLLSRWREIRNEH